SLGPVGVLEAEHERTAGGEALGPLPCSPCDLLTTVVDPALVDEATRESEQVGNRFVPTDGAKLLASAVRRVVVDDPGRRLDHLRKRPVRDALAVREGATHKDRRVMQGRGEVPRETALTDSCFAVDRHEMPATIAHGLFERAAKEGQLDLAPDQRR